jgi:hypothetical protein
MKMNAFFNHDSPRLRQGRDHQENDPAMESPRSDVEMMESPRVDLEVVESPRVNLDMDPIEEQVLPPGMPALPPEEVEEEEVPMGEVIEVAVPLTRQRRSSEDI